MWTSGEDATDYEYIKPVEPYNDVVISLGQVTLIPKYENSFVPARSPAGYYWIPQTGGTDGISGVVTVNELIDYDLQTVLVKQGLDKASPYPVANHCPFSLFKYSKPTDPDFSMDCSLDIILTNQYKLLYGGGGSIAEYCI